MQPVIDKLKKWLYKNKLEIILVLLVMSVYGYFFSCGGANQMARFDVIFAFVEPQTSDYMTFRIDRFIINAERGINTFDWSFYGGHYYSNKAPGSSFLGIPVYFAIFNIERLFGIAWQHPFMEVFNAYLINFFISVLPVSLGILFFYKLLILRGISLKRALMFSLILAFATCSFPYSTELWGHPTAMAFIIFAIYNIEKGKNFNYILAGFFLGFATVTDYLALFVTVTTGLYVLYTNWKKTLYFVSGGILPLIMMLAYHHVCFGNIFNTPLTYTNPMWLEDEKVLGLFGTFSFSIFRRLLISVERGILVAMPVLVFAIPGCYFLIRKKKNSLIFAIYAIVTVLTMLIVNTTFNGWHGGHSACARYQIIAIPFWCLLIAGIPEGKKWRIPLLVVACLSAFNMLAVTAVTVQPFETNWNPIYKTAYRNFFKGNLHILDYPIRLQGFHPDWKKFADITSTNLGQVLGFKGLYSLIPLLMIVVLAILIIRKILKEDNNLKEENDAKLETK